MFRRKERYGNRRLTGRRFTAKRFLPSTNFGVFREAILLTTEIITVQEIYPPKLAEFAYVTDGACTEEEITDAEIILLEVIFGLFFNNTGKGLKVQLEFHFV